MKKATVILGMLAIGGNLLWGAEDFTEDQESTFSRAMRATAWYLPNRLIDLTDVFTFDFGAGAGSSLHVKTTGYSELGWYVGDVHTFDTGYRRRWGTGLSRGYLYSVGCFSDAAMRFKATGGNTETFKVATDGFSLVNPDADCYLDENIDFWAIGVRAGVLLNIGINFHPVELADFFTGWVGCDLTGDDYGK